MTEFALAGELAIVAGVAETRKAGRGVGKLSNGRGKGSGAP